MQTKKLNLRSCVALAAVVLCGGGATTTARAQEALATSGSDQLTQEMVNSDIAYTEWLAQHALTPDERRQVEQMDVAEFQQDSKRAERMCLKSAAFMFAIRRISPVKQAQLRHRQLQACLCDPIPDSELNEMQRKVRRLLPAPPTTERKVGLAAYRKLLTPYVRPVLNYDTTLVTQDDVVTWYRVVQFIAGQIGAQCPTREQYMQIYKEDFTPWVNKQPVRPPLPMLMSNIQAGWLAWKVLWEDGHQSICTEKMEKMSSTKMDALLNVQVGWDLRKDPMGFARAANAFCSSTDIDYDQLYPVAALTAAEGVPEDVQRQVDAIAKFDREMQQQNNGSSRIADDAARRDEQRQPRQAQEQNDGSSRTQEVLATSGSDQLTQEMVNVDIACIEWDVNHSLTPEECRAVKAVDVALFQRDPKWFVQAIQDGANKLKRVAKLSPVYQQVERYNSYCGQFAPYSNQDHCTAEERATIQRIFAHYKQPLFAKKADPLKQPQTVLILPEDVQAGWEAIQFFASARGVSAPSVEQYRALVTEVCTQDCQVGSRDWWFLSGIGNMRANWLALQEMRRNHEDGFVSLVTGSRVDYWFTMSHVPADKQQDPIQLACVVPRACGMANELYQIDFDDNGKRYSAAAAQIKMNGYITRQSMVYAFLSGVQTGFGETLRQMHIDDANRRREEDAAAARRHNGQ